MYLSFTLAYKLSHGMRFPTMWYVGPAKPQTSLRILILCPSLNLFHFFIFDYLFMICSKVLLIVALRVLKMKRKMLTGHNAYCMYHSFYCQRLSNKVFKIILFSLLCHAHNISTYSERKLYFQSFVL